MGHPLPSPAGRVPGRSLSPQLVPTAPDWAPPGLRLCSRDGQGQWPGEMAQPCLLSEAAHPRRDLLPAAAPLSSPFICPVCMAELLLSPLLHDLSAHMQIPLRAHARIPTLPVPRPVRAAIPTSPLLVGPASHPVLSPPTAASWQWGVGVPSKRGWHAAVPTVVRDRAYRSIGGQRTGAPGFQPAPAPTLPPLWLVWGLPWTPGHCWGHRNMAFLPTRTLLAPHSIQPPPVVAGA